MNDVLTAEFDTWKLEDEDARLEKLERERVRYPRIIEELQLGLLWMENKKVLDVGCGPISILEFLPEARLRWAIDPLVNDYRSLYMQSDEIFWVNGEAEKMPFLDSEFDLVVCTNALDHTKEPVVAVREMKRVLKAGGFLAVHCCENNALLNPSPAHQHNLTLSWFKNLVNKDFEIVSCKKVRYGWKSYKGRVGQPAFAILLRKVTGYKEEE